MTMKRFGIFTVAYLSLLALVVPLQGPKKIAQSVRCPQNRGQSMTCILA